MNLEKYICDLLYRHECVIVPEFGGFITNYAPASIQEATHTILPPRKFLVFNSNLTINDGLLANEISNKKNCSFDEAMQFIKREVIAWHERMKAGKTIFLIGIGSFNMNKSGKLDFKPDLEQNFFDEAYGLTSLVVPPLQKRARKPKQQAIRYHKPARKINRKAIRRLAWAAAITIPLVAASIWSILNYDSLRQYAVQHSGIFQVLESEPKSISDDQSVYEVDTSAFLKAIGENAETSNSAESLIGAYGANLGSDIETKVVQEQLTEAILPAASEPVAEPIAKSVRTYHIIIGSFESEINAQHFADELVVSGWNAIKVPASQGMHRVSIASYADKNEALQQLSKIREERNPGAWLLRI
ncbi:MAG: SPOR domain-containing protein [Bacteroidales bacterium]|nr:SPOR domain-containing protein [Bacteroidales bacterium]